MKLLFSGVITVILALALFAVPGAGSGTVYALDENVCGNDFVDVPDSGATFDFTDACAQHDACYADPGTEQTRKQCDDAFLEDMLDSCDQQQRWKRFSCASRAYTYYLGVRIGGWAFYDYAP